MFLTSPYIEQAITLRTPGHAARAFDSILVYRPSLCPDRRVDLAQDPLRPLNSGGYHCVRPWAPARRSAGSFLKRSEIQGLDMGFTPCSISHLLIAAGSNRTIAPIRNDGIVPRFARRRIVTFAIPSSFASSAASSAPYIFRTRDARDRN